MTDNKPTPHQLPHADRSGFPWQAVLFGHRGDGPGPAGILMAAGWRGVRWMIGLSFPVASLIALVHRFPIPFSGHVSGVEGAVAAPIAVLVFGTLMLGFVPLGGLGAVVGLVCERPWNPAARPPGWRLPAVCGVIDLLAGVILSNLKF